MVSTLSIVSATYTMIVSMRGIKISLTGLGSSHVLHFVFLTVLNNLDGNDISYGYLDQIGAPESDLCICGQARATLKHFLF
jgi:hypothetical protein